jgi:hypothetical protein
VPRKRQPSRADLWQSVELGRAVANLLEVVAARHPEDPELKVAADMVWRSHERLSKRLVALEEGNARALLAKSAEVEA